MTRSTLQGTLRRVYITIALVLAISLIAKFVDHIPILKSSGLGALLKDLEQRGLTVGGALDLDVRDRREADQLRHLARIVLERVVVQRAAGHGDARVDLQALARARDVGHDRRERGGMESGAPMSTVGPHECGHRCRRRNPR